MPTASSEIRRLAPGDEASITAFLDRHADSSMILRSNLRDPGLGGESQDLHGVWAGRFEQGALTDVVTHFRNGNLVLQSSMDPVGVSRAALTISGRPVAGILGPWDQAMKIREALGLAEAPQPEPVPEVLFAIDLSALCVPSALSERRLICRFPTEEELPLIIDWRHAYGIETLHASPGAELAEQSRKFVTSRMERGSLFVLEEAGRLVAMTSFNARVPECVQIGGVWTPPELRGRGYARAVVAGSLLKAREEGATRSVLFTELGNIAAQRAYIALGYREVGRYAMLLFYSPQSVR